MVDSSPDYWYSRFVFEKGLALIYLIAFLVAANQAVPLLGARGLLPAARLTQYLSFRQSPSLFFLSSTDTSLRLAAWTGVALAGLALSGYAGQRSIVSATTWAMLWVLYLSFVNVGDLFYGFGWETMLLETGFLAIFLGGRATPPAVAFRWLLAWMLFRVMFGAGTIKLRGDSCWRDLTCLDYYFQTQPIPNPLSWYAHWLPPVVHRVGVLFNHFVELVVPFGYFAPQPIAGIAALATISFQLVLIVSGNLSWLNWLTIVLCIPLLPDRFLSWLPVTPPVLDGPHPAHRVVVYALVVLVAVLSIGPARNLFSSRQLMNYSFNRLHLVNSYGAFGTITRTRYEIVIEGTDDAVIGEQTKWREYEFKGKPGNPAVRPAQIAPYHLRLDWLMWFAAFAQIPPRGDWFTTFMARLAESDPMVVGLLRTNPFPDRPPSYVRALYYQYWFTTPDERRATGQWWRRDLVGEYMPPVARQQ
jgi:hypothetical protein